LWSARNLVGSTFRIRLVESPVIVERTDRPSVARPAWHSLRWQTHGLPSESRYGVSQRTCGAETWPAPGRPELLASRSVPVDRNEEKFSKPVLFASSRPRFRWSS